MFWRLIAFSLIASSCSTGGKSGPVDRDALEDAIKSRSTEFDSCFSHAKKSGTIVTKFVIGAEGKITRAEIKETTLHDPAVENCVLNGLKKIRFPIPKGVNSVTVKYPFRFKAY